MGALPASLSLPSLLMLQELPASPGGAGGLRRTHRPCHQDTMALWGISKAGVNVIMKREVGTVEIAGGSKGDSDGVPVRTCPQAGLCLCGIHSVRSAVFPVCADTGSPCGHSQSDGNGGRGLCPPVRHCARPQGSRQKGNCVGQGGKCQIR